MEAKKTWQSKTLWVALLTAIVPFFPWAQAQIAANPDLIITGLGLLFGMLRLITKSKVDIA